MDDGITITIPIDCPLICKVYLHGIILFLFTLITLGLMTFGIIIILSEVIIISVPLLIIIIKILEFIKPIVLLGYIIMRIVTKFSDKYKWYVLIQVALIAITGLNIYLYIKGCQFNDHSMFLPVLSFTIFALIISTLFEFDFCTLLNEYKKKKREKREKQFPNVDAPPINDQTEAILPPPAFLDRNN